MIAALAYMLLYLACGVLMIRFLLPRHRPLNRLWLGLSLGLLEEMWLPALAAFLLSFTLLAHGWPRGCCWLMTLAAGSCGTGGPRPAGTRRKAALLRQMLWVGLPLTILGAYLQYTHVMRVDAAGATGTWARAPTAICRCT